MYLNSQCMLNYGRYTSLFVIIVTGAWYGLWLALSATGGDIKILPLGGTKIILKRPRRDEK
jgi:hypothetical protein